MTSETMLPLPAADLKSCCADLYSTEMARLLLGESFHPGGMKLTRRLGDVLGLKPGMKVLDVAAGRGASSIELATAFDVDVTGIDYGGINVAAATEAARAAGVADRVRFLEGDAEQLPFDPASFDAVVCECAFCTFPDKPAAAAEFVRVAKPGARIGLSDITRHGELPPELDTLLAWIACIADALPIETYAGHLTRAGVVVDLTEPHPEALMDMVRVIKGKLLGAELLSKLGKLELGTTVDWKQARQMAASADAAVRNGSLGYAVIAGRRA